MAITILPQQTPGLGAAFGTGLGQGLQLLAQQKLEDINAQRLLPNVKAIFPHFSDEQALAFAKSPIKVQQEIIRQVIPAMQALPIETAFEDIIGTQRQLPLVSDNMQALQQQSLSQQQIPSAEQLQQASQLLATPVGMQALQQGGITTPASSVQPIASIKSKKSKKESAPLPPSQIEQERSNLERYLKQSNLTPRQKGQLRERFENRHEKLRKEELEAFKFTKEDRKQIYEAAQAAKGNLRDLERFEELEKEGKLDTAGYNEFLKRSGLDIQALRNPGSEEFIKLANNFVRNAKNVYGGRVTNFEVEQFLRTIPDLSQSPEGRKRIIAAMKQNARANIAYSEAAKDVIRENKGKPPLDLLERIDDKIGKRLDKIAQLFKKDLSKPVPPSQNKAVTAAQAIAGELVGRVPGAIKGAGKGAVTGAAIGRLAGPAGTIPGAIGGGILGLLGLL